MICRHCGANIPDDQLICPVCGAEVQMVPDYNPLEDVLAREVKGSVEGATRQIQTDDIRQHRRDSRTQSVKSTRVIGSTELERIRDEKHSRTNAVRGKASASGRIGGVIKENHRNTEEVRRQRKQKRLAAAKKKRRNLLLTLFFLLVLVCIGTYIAYQNSYTGMIRKGYRAIEKAQYSSAEKYFERAIIKDKSRVDAYVGRAEIFLDQDDIEQAEEVYLSAIETQPTNERLYQAAIDFYMDTEQPEKIASLLRDCEDEKVLSSVSEYISEAPKFSLEEGTYDEVKEVTLSADTGGQIYYTIDGTEPTAENGQKYEEPILLQKEGETVIRAISVNSKGIPSVAVSKKYVIEFPIADAPAVTPSTGQYTETEQITISVPSGYTAYFTMDGTIPDLSSSSTQKYTGPVSMPENTKTIFNAVLVNDQNGKMTEVTTRNYITSAE